MFTLSRRPLPNRLLVFSALLGLLAVVPAQAQTIHYVDDDATGSGDGTSWADAFPHLQAGLAVAEAGDQVWVAEGLYKPTDGGPDPEDRTATFVLPNGVALYGGFEGTEETLEERDWAAYETILSGELGDPNSFFDDSYHILTVPNSDSTTLLDGLTIESASANAEEYPNDRGGGLLMIGGGPTIRNCIFSDNGAYRAGGGVYIEDGNPLIEDVIFEGNVANAGGGLYASGGAPIIRRVEVRNDLGNGLSLENGSDALIEDALFEENQAAGIILLSSSPTIRRTTFRGNSGGRGAGVLMYDDSEPLFEDCLFEDNTTDDAGGSGVFSSSGAVPTFVRTIFRNNVATDNGGGATVQGGPLGSPAYFIDSRFEGNEAPGGAGLYSYFNGTTLLNSTFVGNRSTSTGGAFYVAGGMPTFPVLVANTVFVGNTGVTGGGVRVLASGETEVRLVNTTITGNTATQAGGGLHFSVAPGLRLQNAIVWGNDAPQGQDVLFLEGAPPTFEHSIVGGGCPPAVICHEVFDADPLFVRNPDPGPDGQWGTDDDDYGDLRLQEGSPAEDHGLEAYLPRDRWDLDGDGDTEEPLPVDLGGGPRVIGAAPDLGAYEGVYPVGVQNGPAIGMAARLAVYPNPARDVVVADVTVGAETEVVVALYDVLGRRVARLYEGLLRPGTTPLVVEAPAVPGGVYLVRVTGDGLDLAERVTLLR